MNKNKKMPLIGVSGKINSGKDTVGRIIQYLIARKNDNRSIKIQTAEFLGLTSQNWMAIYQAQDWEIKKFADKLKDIVCLLIGCTRQQLEDREFKEKELGEEWDRIVGSDGKIYLPDDYPDLEYSKLTPRLLLQLLGTECGRQIIHPNIWCNALFAEYPDEVWKDIPGFEDKYQASTKGNIKSLDRKITPAPNQKSRFRRGQVLKPTLSGSYLTVSLEGTTYTVHSLVADTFFPGNKEKNYVVNHKDFNTLNNNYMNLEWISQRENIQYNKTYLQGNFGENQKDAKLNEKTVLEIRHLIEQGTVSQNKIAELYGVSPTTISDIKSGKKWSHIGKEVPKISPITDDVNWIITDVRFPNELEAIKKHKGITIRINRGLVERTGKLIQEPEHPSETALDGAKFDYIIENNGTIEELLNKVKKILINEKII